MTQNRFIDESIITEAIESKDRLLSSTFPIHIFPEKIKDIIRSTNECLNFPIDYISASVIFGISIGIGNTHVVRIKDSWKESCVLYLSLIGPRGVSKSHPITFCLQPFFNHDSTEVIKYRESCLKYEEHTRISKKEREEQSQFTTSIQEPKLKKYIVSDITPESLAYIHENNKRGICLYADELASWFKNFNRYSKGSEEQFWLSSFSGKPIILDRRGTKSTISILNSFIGVVGTMQYGILRDLSRGDRSQNGFMDRILFAMPSQIEKPYWNKLQLPKHIIPLWDNMISILMNLDYAKDANGEVVPIELSYSLEAESTLISWQHKNVNLCELESSEAMIGVYKKMETYISRFSLLIQIMRWICGDSDKKEIDQISVLNAIELVNYFCNTARQVQVIILSTSALEQLSSIQKAIYQNLSKTFTTAEGLLVSKTYGMPERTFKDFLKLNLNVLFSKDKHGLYSKIN